MDNKKLTVEVWSDYVCPFCYIGKRRFEMGLEQFEHADDVVVHFRSFELDPYVAVDGNPPVRDMLAEKYGMSVEDADANIKNITEQANAIGLDFQFDTSIRTNTFQAHRLSHYAAEKGKDGPFAERLLKAHFVEGLHIGKEDVLADLAEEVGLDRDEALRVLRDDAAFADDVRQDQLKSREIGVTGVPHFVINDTYVIRGAHPPETFLGALHKAWEEM